MSSEGKEMNFYYILPMSQAWAEYLTYIAFLNYYSKPVGCIISIIPMKKLRLGKVKFLSFFFLYFISGTNLYPYKESDQHLV